ncbi:MAG: aminoacyl-tRNA hydrolase [Acidobacteriota bacterium]
MPDSYEVGQRIDTVIVGLGNPGEKYQLNRHNIGFLAVDALARQGGGSWSTYLLSRVCRVEIGSRPVLLSKSLTYMNHSGKAVHSLMTGLKRNTEDLLLIYDDLDLPLGRIRIRRRGSSGGHRGVESVLNMVQTDEIMRLRMGIGEEHKAGDARDFVLSDISPEKQTELNEMIQKAGNAVKSILVDGISKSMTIFNA